jgi:hypothetical protein
MEAIYISLINAFWKLYPDCWAGTLRTCEVTDPNGPEITFEWTQWDNDQIQRMEMKIRLALFDDHIAISTWQDNFTRSVSVETVNEGLVVMRYFMNITINITEYLD